MKITIDTKNKCIIIEEDILIEEFIKEISKILKDYKEYKIVNNTYCYTYPNIIYTEPTFNLPYNSPFEVTCSSNTFKINNSDIVDKNK